MVANQHNGSNVAVPLARVAIAVAAVAAGLAGLPEARAASVTTPVTGSLGTTFQTCLQALTTQVGGSENCTYGGTNVSSSQPTGEDIGPLSLGAYYGFNTTPQAFTDPDFLPTNGDGKVAPAIGGSIVVDDNGTPGNASDDLLSFTLVLSNRGGGDLVRVTNNFAERFTRVTHTLAPRLVDAAAPNGNGGFDYIIGSDGFPGLLNFNEAPCAGQPFGSMECSASFGGTTVEPLRWTGWPASAGFGSLEANAGAKTVGVVEGLVCTGTRGADTTTGADITNICRRSQVAWNPVVNGPNETTGVIPSFPRGNAEDVGWDQLLLKVSTDAAGQVTAVAGFDVEDYRATGPLRCGDNGPTANNYTAVCNSWHSSYFTLAGVAAPDGPFDVQAGATVSLDVLANDSPFPGDVTVTVTTPPTQGTAVVVGSPGPAAGVRIEYTADGSGLGADSFQYTVTDGTATGTAAVTLNVQSALPTAADGSIALSSVGVDPATLVGTFDAPGPGGSLGAPGAATPVTIATQGARGTATAGVPPPPTRVTYVPAAGFFTGTDTVVYRITDANGATDTGTITVTIPDATPVLANSVLLASSGLLSPAVSVGVTPGNGAPAQHVVTVVTDAVNGSCLPTTDGRLQFQGDPGFVGSDSCAIRIADGDGDLSEVRTVAITVSPVGRVGGASSVHGGMLFLLAVVAFVRRRVGTLLLRNRVASAASWQRGALAAALASLVSANAMAQTGPAPATADDNVGPQEIIVTTRKVAENLKDVPLAITAFDSSTIQRAGIANLTDVAELTPGLSFFNAFGENLPVPVIRGVAPTDIFGQNNAAIFIDGVFISGREGLNFSQLDFERIEVVKGPQSAQYGRNAFSGAINYVTKDPGDEFEARTVLEAGNDGKQRGLAMVSGPILGETLSGRISYQYDEWDGSYSNPASDVDVGGYRYRSWQGKLLWEPLDDLRVSLAYYNSNDRVDDPAVVSLPANCEDRLAGAPTNPPDNPEEVRFQNFCGQVPDIESVPGQNGGTGIAKAAAATGEVRLLDRVILRADWTFEGIGTLTSLSGYSNTEQRSVSDFNRNLGENQLFLYCQSVNEFGPAPNSCGPNPANLQFFTGIINPEGGDETEEWSQEFRFATDPERRWRAVLGAFAYRTRNNSFPGNPQATRSIETLPGWPNLGFPPFDREAPDFAIGTAIFYQTFRPDGGLDPLNRREFLNANDGWAAFSGLDFDLTDRLTVRGEVRFAYDSQSSTNFRYQRCFLTGDLDPALPPDNQCPSEALVDPSNPDLTRPIYDTRPEAIAPVLSVRGSDRFEAWVGRIGMDFKINDDWLAYWSLAEGDKPGGVQLVEVTVVTGSTQEDRLVPNSFQPEKITAYELGLKGTLFDRLSLDMAVFYNDWRDIVLRQQETNDPSSGLLFDQPTAFNRNSGDARVLGAEFSGSLPVTDRLTVSTTLGWTDAELRNANFVGLEFFPTFAPSNSVSGNKLLRQPEWDASASVAWNDELAGDWSWYARGDVTYQSGVYVGNDNQSYLPERTYVNGRLGLRSSRYSVELWGRNLFNDTGAVAAFRDIYFGNTDDQVAPYDADLGPRPGFDKFVPFRYTVSYPRERTYGLNFEVRFGGLVR